MSDLVAMARRSGRAPTAQSRATNGPLTVVMRRLQEVPTNVTCSNFGSSVRSGASSRLGRRSRHCRTSSRSSGSCSAPRCFSPSRRVTGSRSHLSSSTSNVFGASSTRRGRSPRRTARRNSSRLLRSGAGRQAEALQIYHDTRRVLVDELGIDPSPNLQRLHGAILRQDAALDVGTPRAETRADRLGDVAATLLAGRLVPVLGADVAELTTRLAERFEYPANGDTLPRVAQYIAVMNGSGPLYDELHTLLETGLPPTSVHRFFASLPPLLRERGVPHQLIVTTSYDLALERAFLDAGEEFDVVSYLAAGRNRGKFCHVAPDGSGTLIEVPNTYANELSLERRTIILKLHGQVGQNADDRRWESFVVTEDDYIDYLAQSEMTSVVPVALGAKLRRSHFLFLGYTMADWNLRLLLHRLWGDEPLSYRSWAVQPEPMPLEREFWRRRDVDVLEIPLERYTEALARHIGLEPAEASA